MKELGILKSSASFDHDSQLLYLPQTRTLPKLAPSLIAPLVHARFSTTAVSLPTFLGVTWQEHTPMRLESSHVKTGPILIVGHESFLSQLRRSKPVALLSDPDLSSDFLKLHRWLKP